MDDTYIKSVSIQGFKSFGGDRQTVSFIKGFNLIAGANGSGKSNILDAICFALGVKCGALRVNQMSELLSASTSEVCEVEISIHSSIPSSGKKKILAATHTLSAKLMPDFSRQLKIDGKLRTAKEVKEFLRERRLHIEDSSAILQQAKVTALADNNSPRLIASIIGSASGAGRWNMEVREAIDTVGKTEKALEEINGNITLLDKAIANDNTRLKAMARSSQVEYEISEESCKLKNYQQRLLSKLEDSLVESRRSISTKQENLNELQAEKTTLSDSQNTCEAAASKRLSVLEHRRLSILQNAARAEEQRAAVNQKIEHVENATVEMEVCQQSLADLEGRIMQATIQLEDQRFLLCRLEGEASKSKMYGMTEAGSFGIGYIQEMEKKLQSANEQLMQETSEKKDTETAIAGVEQEIKLMEVEMESLPSRNNSAVQQLEHWRSKSALADVKHMELKKSIDEQYRRLKMFSAQLGEMDKEEAALPAWPFHSLFTFKPEYLTSGDKSCLESLNVIAGTFRSICVVKNSLASKKLLELWDTAQASRVGFTRIWPLDRLTFVDRTRHQRNAQRQFSKGAVVLPEDILDYEDSYKAAFLKEFGSYVIAKDDEIAKSLTLKYNIWSVTLDGTINREGSVVGGWRGDRANKDMNIKFEHDKIAIALQDTQNQLRSILEEKELLLSEGEKWNKEARMAKDSQMKEAAIQESLQSLRLEMTKYKTALERRCSCINSLTEEVARLVHRIEKHRVLTVNNNSNPTEAITAALEAAKTDMARLQENLNNMQCERTDCHERQQKLASIISKASLEELNEDMHRLSVSLENYRTELQQVEHDIASETEAANKEAEDMATAANKLQKVAEEIEAHTFDIGREMENLSKLERQKDEAIQELKELPLCQEPSSQGTGSSDMILNKKQYQVCKRKLDQLLSEQQALRSEQQQLSLDEQVAFNERIAKLETFKQRAASIVESIETLNKGIEKNRLKVQAVNEATFNAIRVSFIQCCKHLLPNKLVDLKKVGTDVDCGVQFIFANKGNEKEGAVEYEWKSNLSELSGGQRTLMSLAFTLTVAKAGHSSLYILDEVDAALDEQNQQLVANLIKKHLCSESQVICISHNVSFQRFTDNVIQVTRWDGTTKVDLNCVDSASTPHKKIREGEDYFE